MLWAEHYETMLGEMSVPRTIQEVQHAALFSEEFWGANPKVAIPPSSFE